MNVAGQRKAVIIWGRRRYRDRIWGVTPEMWLAISFTFLVLGASLLYAGSYITDGTESDRELAYKSGAFLMFIGWAVFVVLIETVKTRHGYRYALRNPNAPFVGVYLPPAARQEWLSAALLPEIRRGWVAQESEPWFEPELQFPQPPGQDAEEEEVSEDTPPILVTKKKRNRKKKNNLQISEVDSAECSSEITGQNEVLDESTSLEQPGESNREDLQSQSLEEIDSARSNPSGEYSLEESDQIRCEQKDSHQTSSQDKDSNQPSVEDINSVQTSDQYEGPYQASGQSKESQQTSGKQKNTHQTIEEVNPEKSNKTSANKHISNTISSGGNAKVSELSNETSTHSNQIHSDNPELPVQISDHPLNTKSSGGMQQVDSSNLDSRQSTSKKRNRRKRK